MELVYGIHEGCIFDGGGTGRVLYKDKNKAISEAMKIFEDKVAFDEESKKMDEEDGDFTLNSSREYYRWRKCDKEENRWHNTVDEIEVTEYTIK